MNETVSVIMPVYNAEKYIAFAIDSVLAQSYSNWELLIVDDCSTDLSVSLVSNYVKKDDRVHLFHTDKPSGSPCEPRNIGIRYARGRYIAFLDSDDMWLPNKLEEQLKMFEGGKIAIVYSNYEKISEEAVRQYILTLLVLLIVPAVNLSGLTLSRMRKRISEIGVRKAFGAPRRELMMQVLSENMLYSLFGGILGLVLSYVAAFLLGGMLFSVDFVSNGVEDLRTMCVDLLFDPTVFLLAFLACFLLNLLSAVIPAWRVTRTNIVDAINER